MPFMFALVWWGEALGEDVEFSVKWMLAVINVTQVLQEMELTRTSDHAHLASFTAASAGASNIKSGLTTGSTQGKWKGEENSGSGSNQKCCE